MSYEFLSILIIEDDKKTRDYLYDILSLHFKVVYVAEDGCVGLEMFKKYAPHVVMADIKMPCMDGLEVLKALKEMNADVVSIVCSAFSDKEYLLSAIDIKVDAYMIKPININTLLEKISLSISSLNLDKSQKHTILSAREYEVFLNIARGVKPIDIASSFGIKPKTIGTYRKRILEKMNFKSNAEIVSYAIKNHLI
jgi:DNA-binding NarL/FixJ family response regulator